MNCGQTHAKVSRQKAPGFTLLELMLVITIIAALAAVALPHMGGMTKANSMSVATRQVLDDVALARQKALSTRSSVYMVFLSDSFLRDVDPKSKRLNQNQFNQLSELEKQRVRDVGNNQLRAYALVSLRSVGDQPGQNHVRYLTDWKVLPDGVFIHPSQFSPGEVFFTLADQTSYRSITNITSFPFPSSDTASTFGLRCIKFTAQGQMASGHDEFIPLTSGSVLVPNLESEPIITETPVGAFTNNFNVIAIDSLTGRAKLMRKEIQ